MRITGAVGAASNCGRSGPARGPLAAELVQGAEKVLTDAGTANQAAQVSHLFTTNAHGDQISIGMVEIERNPVVVRADEARAKRQPVD